MNNASRAGRVLSKLGASKGGRALAALLTPEQRQARARKAVKARWKRTNGGRLTQDQQRVMKRLEGLESVALPISDGPAGRRRRAAIVQLVTVGRLKVLAESAELITIASGGVRV
jgi:hypothetical protein